MVPSKMQVERIVENISYITMYLPSLLVLFVTCRGLCFNKKCNTDTTDCNRDLSATEFTLALAVILIFFLRLFARRILSNVCSLERYNHIAVNDPRAKNVGCLLHVHFKGNILFDGIVNRSPKSVDIYSSEIQSNFVARGKAIKVS